MKNALFGAVFCGILGAVFMSGCSSTKDKIAKLDKELKELRTQKFYCQMNKDFKCVDELNKKGEEILKEIRELRKSL
ncbi:TPA: hypothetical protein R9123_001662 [Campylobacter upsaliensis]|nr:hypothetical protein [Campylobacter upsaliensis]